MEFMGTQEQRLLDLLLQHIGAAAKDSEGAVEQGGIKKGRER